MLGTDAVRILGATGAEVIAHTRSSLDLFDPAAIAAAVADVDVVLNCAAWTAVDDAETDEDAAYRVNAELPGILAAAVRAGRGRLVHISTDYVFAGDAAAPYPEDAPLAPRSAYGRTKAAGEQAVREELPDRSLIVRTAWLYGAHGGCFPATIARVAAERGGVAVVDDQIGQPTWTCDVVDLVERLVDAQAPAGIYHGTASGKVSWFDFARRVVASYGMDPEIVTPTDSAAFVRLAPRPAYSVLGHGALERLGIAPIGDWAERWDAAAAAMVQR